MVGINSDKLGYVQIATLNNFAIMQERRGGRALLLIHRLEEEKGEEVEEVVHKVQGYLVDESLPPVRQQQ